MGLLTDEHRAWIGKPEPLAPVEVSRRDIIKYSVATEQRQAKYLKGDEAPPMFIFNLFGRITELDKLRTDGLTKRTGRTGCSFFYKSLNFEKKYNLRLCIIILLLRLSEIRLW